MVAERHLIQSTYALRNVSITWPELLQAAQIFGLEFYRRMYENKQNTFLIPVNVFLEIIEIKKTYFVFVLCLLLSVSSCFIEF